MAFVSDAQRRKFYATPRLHKFIKEFDAATPAGDLPDRITSKRTRKKLAKVARKRALS